MQRKSSLTKLRRTVAAASLAVATVATSLAVTAVAPAQAAARPVTSGCASTTIIGARGSSQFLGTVKDQLSGFGPQVKNAAVNAASRLSTTRTVRYDRLLYSAQDADVIYNYTHGVFQASVAAGIARVKVQVDYWVRTCPNTKIFLIGYSQGAWVMHEAAARLPVSTTRHISGVALISDPRRNVNDPNTFDINVGAANRNGIAGPGPVFTNGLGARVYSFCHVGDPVCNGWSTWNTSVHTGYYQTPVAAAWVGKYVASRLIRDGVR